MTHILLQNDDSVLSSEGDITIAKNRQILLQLLVKRPFDLVVVEDLDLFSQIKGQFPHLPVAIATWGSSIPQAVEAMRKGAFDYLSKPLQPDQVDRLIKKLRDPLPKKPVPSPVNPGKRETILAESAVMQQVLSDIEKVAKSSASVFICGESGTGKEVVAHAIHYQSSRSTAPFIKVNCAAIPEALIESEFFGHEKGAFTGALDRRIGRFELADRGTLLLDEVSEIPTSLQAKLLRVVQEQEFERVGGTKPLRVDTRLISTSNRSMKEMIEQKQFREDLYFRLNVIPIHLPPLRERKEDILGLADYFLERFCEANCKKKKVLSPSAQHSLLEYSWPGNIRELANAIERVVVMQTADTLESSHFSLDPAEPALLPLATLAEVEKEHILDTLSRCNHNRTQAAAALGINIRTLRNKLRLYHL